MINLNQVYADKKAKTIQQMNKNILDNAKNSAAQEAAKVAKPQLLTMSPWMDMAIKDRQDLTNQQVGNLGAQQQAANMMGANALAMRGGMSQSAADRLARIGEENAAINRQSILGQGESDVLGLQQQKETLQDAINKYNTAATNNAGQFNVNTAIQGVIDANAANQAKYQNAMTKYGAEKTSQAMDNNKGGKK